MLKLNPVSTADFEALRQDFPILRQKINGKPLVYLDSAASSQKPQRVLDAIHHYYSQDHANVSRGVHNLSARATQQYAAAREKVKTFINAETSEEIIFVRSATEAINLVASSYGRQFMQAGDEIILTVMEHHSNIVPWQLLAEQRDLKLRVVPISDQGELDLGVYQKLLSPKTKMVAVTHVSNVLGTINPIKEMIALAHRHSVPVLVDGAQAVGHMPVDVRELDCDFYVFSSHKSYGPTGVGVLYGKKALLEAMPPYQGGGGMIETVSFAKTTYAPLPNKFEAGTPSIAEAIGFGVALDYLSDIGVDQIFAHEQRLVTYATAKLGELPAVHIIGEASQKLGVLSFLMDKVHPHDLGTLLDSEGVAVRVGHHCAMPLMERLQVSATARASFGLYTSLQDIDALINGLIVAQRFFS